MCVRALGEKDEEDEEEDEEEGGAHRGGRNWSRASAFGRGLIGVGLGGVVLLLQRRDRSQTSS